MKIIWRIAIAIWFLTWTILGIGIFLNTPTQINKDNKFKAEKIDPVVDAVRSFVQMNDRIPTNTEFNKININKDGELIRNYDDLPDEFKTELKNDSWDSDTYAIAFWRGEWNEGYISKNDIYVLNDYSWTSGLLQLLIFIVLGLLPTILTLLVSKVKLSKSGSAQQRL